jgi:hypothetical protein
MTSNVCTLELIRCPFEAEDYLGVVCPDCHSPVVIHQPDEWRPDRLLGTCGSCSAWYLIAPAVSTMVRLPDDEAFGGSTAASPRPAKAVLAARSRR